MVTGRRSRGAPIHRLAASISKTFHAVTPAVIIIVIWIALGLVVVALFNLAKHAVRARPAARTSHTGAPAWPAPNQAQAPSLRHSSVGGKRSAA